MHPTVFVYNGCSRNIKNNIKLTNKLRILECSFNLYYADVTSLIFSVEIINSDLVKMNS